MDKKIAIIIAAAAIIVVAAAAVFLMNSGDDRQDSSNNGATVGTVLKALPDDSSRLWVYGNANQDDRIDSADVDYIRNVVKGSASGTILCDANCDGKVDSADADYVSRMISAQRSGSAELDVYYIDYYDTVSKVSWPVKSITIGYCSGAYTADLIGVADKVKMVDGTIQKYWASLNPAYSKAISFGTDEEPDTELVMKTEADVYVAGYPVDGDQDIAKALRPAGIDVMFLATADGNSVVIYNTDRMIVMQGYLLQGDMDKTYRYLDWHDGIIGKIRGAVSGLSDPQKKTLFMSRTSPAQDETGGKLTICGRNQVNAVHMEISGAYSAGLYDSLTIGSQYSGLTYEQVYTLFKNEGRDTDGDGVKDVYLIYNGHDGMRQTRDLEVQAHGIADVLTESPVNIHYMGMARESGNTPFYIIELVLYLQVLYPELASSAGLDYVQVFNEYFSTFDSTAQHASVEHYFADFGKLTSAVSN